MSIELIWKPNPNVPYPNVWNTFKAKDIDNDELVEYRIESLPENRFDDIFNLYMEFVQTEPRNALLKTSEDPALTNAFRIFCRIAFEQKLIVVCFREGSNEIVGFNIMFVVSKEDNLSAQSEKLVRMAFGRRRYASVVVNCTD